MTLELISYTLIALSLIFLIGFVLYIRHKRNGGMKFDEKDTINEVDELQRIVDGYERVEKIIDKRLEDEKFNCRY